MSVGLFVRIDGDIFGIVHDISVYTYIYILYIWEYTPTKKEVGKRNAAHSTIREVKKKTQKMGDFKGI